MMNRIAGAPMDSYPPEDQAFYRFWYGHMLNDLMQPPLAEVSHATARYIWDAARATPEAAASVPVPLTTETEVLSDVDPVVLQAWKIQGRKVGAMLREAQAAVIELQEARPPREDMNNYSRILTLLGMEEEGDPVEAVQKLVAESDAAAEIAAGVAVPQTVGAVPNMEKIEQSCVNYAALSCLGVVKQAYRFFYAQGKTEDDFDKCAWDAMAKAVRHAVKLTAQEVRDPVWPYVAASPEAPTAAPGRPINQD